MYNAIQTGREKWAGAQTSETSKSSEKRNGKTKTKKGSVPSETSNLSEMRQGPLLHPVPLDIGCLLH
jgi:hypothetical protein